jgi:hypothetical protein
MGSGSGLPAYTTRPAKRRQLSGIGCQVSATKAETDIQCSDTGLFFPCPAGWCRPRACVADAWNLITDTLTGTDNESDQADRAISTGKLHALLRFHTRPIDVVVFHGSQGRTRFEVGFPLRCFQRLSRPHIATLQCGWRHNRSTRGASIPVLSY